MQDIQKTSGLVGQFPGGDALRGFTRGFQDDIIIAHQILLGVVEAEIADRADGDIAILDGGFVEVFIALCKTRVVQEGIEGIELAAVFLLAGGVADRCDEQSGGIDPVYLLEEGELRMTA